MKILAIVVTYNGMKWYDRCFTSLKSSTIPVDIFVADNASSDGTVDYIKTNFPAIILYESDINLGFGQANNKGMRYALDNSYDFVFLLNQDAWLARIDSIEQLINSYSKYPEFAIISPIQLYGHGNAIIKSVQKNLIIYDSNNNDILSDFYLGNQLNNIYPVDYVCAAAWLIPKLILQNIGGFDPLFFHYGEDDNYMHRVVFHGFKIGICPYSSICHDIENRKEDYGGKYNNWEKNFLVNLANINDSLFLNREIFQKFYLSIIKLLTLRFKSAAENFMVAIFILRNKTTIKISRSVNRQTSQNWL